MKYTGAVILLFLSYTAFSQIKKGDWLVNGRGSVISTQSDRSSASTNINMKISLGYFFRDNWMAGGSIDIRTTRFSARTINEVFARHYLRDTLFNTRIYAEARWIFQQSTPIGFGTNRGYRGSAAVLALGLNRFISPQLAIEAQLDYHFFQRFKNSGQASRLEPGHLSTRLGIQYFFRYRDWKAERKKDYRDVLKRGSWMIGGRMTIAERLSQTFYFEQNFNPSLAFFIKRNWAFGSELNYTSFISYSFISLGLSPFSRYYLNVGRKKKIYGELRTAYLRTFNRQGGTNNSKGDEWQYGLALGLSNFINENVSFDISYSFQNNMIRSNDFSIRSEFQRRGFNFSLHYFFTKKKS